MKVLGELTDREVLGTEGYSHAGPRLTARAIVKNEKGLFAVMYAEKFNLVQGHILDEVYARIASPVHNTNQRKFLQARDVAPLRAFMK